MQFFVVLSSYYNMLPVYFLPGLKFLFSSNIHVKFSQKAEISFFGIISCSFFLFQLKYLSKIKVQKTSFR